MKITIFRLTAAGALALAATATARAQSQPAQGGYVTTTHVYLWPGYMGPPPGQAGDIYFNGEIGGTLQQNLSIRNAGQKVSFDPGERGDISVGFDITEALAIELQTGASYNNINTGGTQALALAGYDADLYQIPILANLIFKAPLPGGLTPYVGAGFGGVASELDTHTHGFWASDTDFTPGYQALAGVNCTLNRHTEFGVGYRLLGTTAHTWFPNDPVRYTPAGQTFSHSIMATLTVSF
jgi:opacity protein-like surface antigen